MNILKNNFDVSPDFNLKAIASVEGLANYDMIYIYHHLKTGSNLSLKKEGEGLKGEMLYGVYFRQFKLGFIRLSGFMKEVYNEPEYIEAEISSLSKKKYLPIQGLDISLRTAKLKKVS